MKWSSLQLISPDCYRGRCQLRSQNCRECHIQLKTEIAEQTCVKKHIHSKTILLNMIHHMLHLNFLSYLWFTKKLCQKKMGLILFKALTGLTTNLQLVSEEKFCLQILKALWDEFWFKTFDILQYFSIISLWCGIGISYPVVICICIWPQPIMRLLIICHLVTRLSGPRRKKNCHSQIMRRQQELFGEGSRSGLQNRCSSFCQDVKMVDAGMARNHVCYLLNSAWKREEIKAWLELVRDIKRQ